MIYTSWKSNGIVCEVIAITRCVSIAHRYRKRRRLKIFEELQKKNGKANSNGIYAVDNCVTHSGPFQVAVVVFIDGISLNLLV